MTHQTPSVDDSTFQKVVYNSSCCGRLCGRIIRVLSSDTCLLICVLAVSIFALVGGLVVLTGGTMGLAGYLGAQGSLMTTIATNSGLAGIIATEIGGGVMILAGLITLVISSVMLSTGFISETEETVEEQKEYSYFSEYKYTCADGSRQLNLRDLMGSDYDPTTCGIINVTYTGQGRTKKNETIGFWHDKTGTPHFIKGKKSRVEEKVLSEAVRSGVPYKRKYAEEKANS